MKIQKNLIFAFIFLIIAWSFLHLFICNYSKNNNLNSKLIHIIPERLRSFIAARLWEKADHIMHLGPVISKQHFVAGSYAGNTDLIPYLKMVIMLCPEEVAPYRLLASNYAYHLGMKQEALSLTKQAISNCSNSQFIHELYATAAFIHLFSNNSNKEDSRNKELELANEYIEKAISSYIKSDYLSDPIFTLENYYIIRARIFWELEKPDQALFSWKKSEKKLEESPDILASLILKYRQTGVYEKIKNSKIEKTDSNYIPTDTCSKPDCEHNHEKSPLQAFVLVVLKAGLVSITTIILYFLCSKSYGTGSSSFRFFAGK